MVKIELLTLTRLKGRRSILMVTGCEVRVKMVHGLLLLLLLLLMLLDLSVIGDCPWRQKERTSHGCWGMAEMAISLKNESPVGHNLWGDVEYPSEETGGRGLEVAVLGQNSIAELSEGPIEFFPDLHSSKAALTHIII